MSERITFTKMHGCGNDYIYIDCFDGLPSDPADIAVRMSKRHFSVGADGIVLICQSEKADAFMRMFNADGSEGKMCGNAIRCVGKYLYDKAIVEKDELKIETLSGIKNLKMHIDNGKAFSATVDMGISSLRPSDIPVLSDKQLIEHPITVSGRDYNITAVSMGNPHAVTFVDEVSSIPLEKIGPYFEHLSIFPERVNTEFVRVIDRKTLEMRVWERGSGETYACGTGACATVVAACVTGRCDFGTEVTVKLVGGDLIIKCENDFRVYMTGSAEKVYEGIYNYENKA